MGDNTGSGGHGGNNDPIPFSAQIPSKSSNVIPVAVAAFVGGLVGALVGVSMG